MPYKFEQLDVWKLALDYLDLIYELAENLSRSEEYNLKSQITRAATSITLNIAEGSQGQSDAEQARFLGMAIRSLIETVACHKAKRRRAVIGIMPRYHSKQDRGVSYRAPEWSRRILVRGNRKNPITTYQS